MIEIIKLRNDRDTYIKSLEKRGIEKIEKKLEELINLDDDRKSLKTELDKLLTDPHQYKSRPLHRFLIQTNL